MQARCLWYNGFHRQLRMKESQLERIYQGLGLAGRKVTMVEKADGRITLLNGSRPLQWKELAVRTPRVAGRKIASGPAVVWRPPAGHPWRSGPAALCPGSGSGCALAYAGARAAVMVQALTFLFHHDNFIRLPGQKDGIVVRLSYYADQSFNQGTGRSPRSIPPTAGYSCRRPAQRCHSCRVHCFGAANQAPT